MNEKCSPDELKYDSGLFERDSDFEEWLDRQHCLVKVVRRNGKIVSVVALKELLK